MAMFSTSEREAPRPATEGRDARISILAPGTTVAGELRTDGVVRIEGKVEGSLHAGGQVLVAKGGVVQGDIRTREAIIAGEVRGGIFAEQRVELQASCKVDGDVTTPQIVIQEGGKLDGRIRMAKPEAAKPGQRPGSDAVARPIREIGGLKSAG